ncbi:AAA family ATPase [Streptomyces sp. NPDC090025]|uniref:AAA family ATPase n=1 Tax=Streptomyces sp. NPDC090025 TaxID=3365922 RepID=UPI00383386CC
MSEALTHSLPAPGPGAGAAPDDPTTAAYGLLRRAFARLDGLLGRAVEGARERWGTEAQGDPFRGLYLSAEQVDRAFGAPAGEPLFARPTADGPMCAPSWREITDEGPGWDWLAETYALSGIELDMVLLALAPELDLRYERIFGYLQDDVSRRRPTVALALDLLTATGAERLAARALFGADAPLVARRVLRLVAAPGAVAPPLLAHFLVPDEQITDLLLGRPRLDRRLLPYCRLATPTAEDAERPVHPDLAPLARQLTDGDLHRPLRLHLHGPRNSGRHRAARALAARLGLSLLTVPADRLPEAADELAETLALILRAASLRSALVHVRDPEAVAHPHTLATALARHPGDVVLASTRAWTPVPGCPLGLRTVTLTRGGAGWRRSLWERTLTAHGATAGRAAVDEVADRFRLGPGQIEDAVVTALAAADGTGARLTRPELFAAARIQSAPGLAALARPVVPARGWDDLVLPDTSLTPLRELCERITHRRTVMDDWGFARSFPHGKGVTALFAGPPGTGKTMAAEVIARELGLELFAVDLSTVISRYVGETEKNLERIFSAADETDAVLLFDEAEALFGKRTEVRDAHDRYANTEIAYLLQRMEQYDGLAVLTTNLRGQLDPAFIRRLQFVVDFPFPEEAERRRLWERALPPGAPLAPGIDLDALATGFRVSGGGIRNITLHAAHLAAVAGTPIGTAHLLAATRREYEKAGKVAPGIQAAPRELS